VLWVDEQICLACPRRNLLVSRVLILIETLVSWAYHRHRKNM
jgi:hypothetical protein